MQEVWKDIEDFKGLYQVSNTGKVRSLNYNRTGQIRELKPGINRGYLQMKLFKSGYHKAYFIHRLVAKAFIPNPDNLPEVNHKDEDKTNNNVSNLEWCSRSYNNTYGTIIERGAITRGKSILQFDKQSNFIKEWPSVIETQRQLGISQSNICKCCKGNLQSSGGYIWRYK